MMVINSLLLSASTLPHLIPTTYKPLSPPSPENAQYLARNLRVTREKTSKRGTSVVTRAGPSTTSFIFAFIFPLSLLAVTIVTSVRIAHKLDQKFFEELAMEQAILEAQEEDDDEIPSPPERETTTVHNRNRPKREVEPSSK